MDGKKYGPDNLNDQDTATAVSIWINDDYFIYPASALVKRDLDPDQLVRNEGKKLKNHKIDYNSAIFACTQQFAEARREIFGKFSLFLNWANLT